MFLKRAWAEIDTSALVNNFNLIKEKSCGKVMAVVKANAYGHGVNFVAPALNKAGADWFAVSNIEEAIQLRELGIEKPILVLGYTPKEAFELLIKYNVSQTVYDYNSAVLLSNVAKANNSNIKIHIKLDTGMSRIGFDCRDDELNEIYDVLKTVSLQGLFFEGAFTHFAVSDSNEKDDIAFTKQQYKRFLKVLEALKEQGFEPTFKHCNNSAAVLNYGFKADINRVGISLYGLDPESKREIRGLKSVMAFKSVVSFVKKIKKGDSVSYGRTFVAEDDMMVATVSVGYADGYPRLASNKAYVLINGEKAKVIGRVCMDQLVCDVTNIKADVGDEVVLFGDGLPVEALAECASTINYEIICGVSKRVPRIPK